MSRGIASPPNPAGAAPAAPAGPRPESTGAALLNAYRSGDAFFYASPRGSLLARAAGAVVPSVALAALPDAVREVLADAPPGAVAVGALPFDPAAPTRLTVPPVVRRGSALPADLPLPAAPAARVAGRRELPSPAGYVDSVRAALADLEAGRLTKVVLARAVELTTEPPVDPALLLRRLAARDPGGHLFAVRADEGGTLVGGSPELLVARHGRAVRAMPLAGSLPRGADPVSDERNARELLADPKCRHEHAVLVDAVRAALAPLCAGLVVPDEPHLVHTARMWHLATVVRGRLADPTTCSLRLAAALHPTPAVGGIPRAAALAAIAAHEPVDRGLYAGLTGWQDGTGNGEWTVTLRCALVHDERVRLSAGAGVVTGSDPAAELAETGAKLQTVLAGLGL
ncbi:isochorismate synthase DhbC [Pilimelia anulata]|uniref:isochorismate synthase n=1 Tax=Pilimelia anulata TaxID=53371 RepID=A0A8J3BA42_9ACTN|nr:isochorismate synthase [Pilimelia anulata]GGK04101.1 isochorismate synthase DhbC [Pilimelia anulata]